jgi:hypothetical protein
LFKGLGERLAFGVKRLLFHSRFFAGQLDLFGKCAPPTKDFYLALNLN